jgi:drug/metabolite transporter (DMT)-like permease
MLSALLSGANYVLGKVVLTDLSPAHLVALIFSIATLIQGAWMIQTGQWREVLHCSARAWFYVLIFSALSIVALWTLWAGVKYLDPSIAAFISRLQTLVTVFLGIWLLGERFRVLEAVGGLVVIAGVALLYATAGVKISLWFWVMVGSGFFWGVTEVVAKVALRHINATPLSFIRTGIVALFYLLLMTIQGQPLLGLGNKWWGVIGIALMGPTLARWFYLFALKRLAVSKAALVNQIQPIFVAIVAFTFLGTIPGIRDWIGGLLILAGCSVMIWGQYKGLGIRD